MSAAREAEQIVIFFQPLQILDYKSGVKGAKTPLIWTKLLLLFLHMKSVTIDTISHDVHYE